MKKAHGLSYVTDEEMNLSHFFLSAHRVAAKKLFGRVCVQLFSFCYTPSLKQQPSAARQLFCQPQIGKYLSKVL